MDVSSDNSSIYVSPNQTVSLHVPRMSSNNGSFGNESVYDSAEESISSTNKTFDSLNESLDENSTTLKNSIESTPNSSAEFNETLNNSRGLTSSPLIIDEYPMTNNNNINNNNQNEIIQLIQSESTETNMPQEEVNPKSQLANKTIFKSPNPSNLSIIEISDNSIKEEDATNSIVLVEPASDDEAVVIEAKLKAKIKKSPNKVPNTVPSAATNDNINNDKRRKKTEPLLQSSKRLDISIIESSRDADTIGSDGDKCAIATEPQEETKREIKVYDTIEEFERNLPPTVTVLDTPFGSKVYLVGTAHFSEESQDDVSLVIRNVRPDVVMVELCPSRIHILKLDEKTLLEEAKNFTISKIRGIIQAHGYINGIFFILLLQMSAQIAKDLGMAPGGEFRRAFEEIHKLPGCILHLGDRPIRITLHRALRALSLWQTIKLVWRLTSTDTISIQEVEECKQRDLLEKLMQEMAGEFPAFSDVFVKERDLFLCHSLQLAALPQTPLRGCSEPRPVRVVGVVGIGHANGIAKMWGRVDPQKIPAILEIPPASLSTRISKYILKYGLIGVTLYGAFKILKPRVTRFF